MEKLANKTWVEIDAAALKKNAAALKKLAGSGALLGMIKCNAYGHGMVEVARLLQKSRVDWFGVDTLDEAITLRKTGITKPILVITYTPAHRLPLLLRYNVDQTVSDLASLRAMAKSERRGKPYRVHLKIDTGMSRQGILPHELKLFLGALKQHEQQIDFVGLLTHFSTADDTVDKKHFLRQQRVMLVVITQLKRLKQLPPLVHAHNTAALLAPPNVPGVTMHRVGIGLYGLAPAPALQKSLVKQGIKPALSWKTRIIQIKKMPKGAVVGYGATEKLNRATILAVLPVGYYDGLSRLYSSVGHVLVGGRRCRIVGRISMNLCVVDITHIRPLRKVWRDEVVLIGRQGRVEITADEFAKKTLTINYEVVTRINPLIPRIVI